MGPLHPPPATPPRLISSINAFTFLATATILLVLLPTSTEARFFKLHHLGGRNGHIPGTASHDLCRVIDHPNLCYPIADRVHGGGVAALAEATAQETMSKASAAKAFAIRLQGGRPKSSMTYKLLDVCRTNFDSMTGDLQEVMRSLVGHGKGPIRNNLSALNSYLETCLDGYSESMMTSPFDGAVGSMQGLVDNLFWFADHMKH